MRDPRPTPIRRLEWPGSSTRAIGSPIQPSVVYRAESPDAMDDLYEGRAPGFSYAREAHPNAAILSQRISAMEGAGRGIVTGSGMAAVTAAALGVLSSGDHVLGANQLYGRSLRLMQHDLPRFGMATGFADPTDVESIAAALRPETRMVLIEVVSNPTLRVADLDRIAELTRSRGILLAVDNTFTTPRAIRPLEHGADIVIHSITKLLAGHSDATLGFVASENSEIMANIEGMAVTMGLTASPFDCWLAERGLMTFDLRYDRAEANAARLADHLASLPGISRVIYPGRTDHPDQGRVTSLLGHRTGNMVTFDVEGGRIAANALVRAADRIPFAPTLGDVGTTLSHPATSSHRALGEQSRDALGITEGTFRVSVGVEEIDTLCEEFETAIAAAVGAGD